MFRFTLLFMITILIYSCSKNQELVNDNVSNLDVDIEVSNDNSEKVVITASADKATDFHFYVNDGLTQDPNISQTGTYTHIYTSTGTYLIEVRAYGANGRYVNKTKQVAVVSGNIIDVGEGYTTPLSYSGMDLVWNDEFETLQVNQGDWSYEIGNGCPNLCGWGNQELEYYKKENSWVNGGVLTIEAHKENFDGYQYTSTRMITQSKQSFQYGRVDIRAILPKGQGIWPALWMLGKNINSVGWPKCGEIDIIEMVGGNGKENTISNNIFWDDNGKEDEPISYSLTEGTFTDEYHVFSLIWDKFEIKWFVDDHLTKTFDITLASRSEFHKPFFFIFNVAVGGLWPGNPNETTIFPTQMKVDYIRVFQDN